jgi:hypothetical protein
MEESKHTEAFEELKKAHYTKQNSTLKSEKKEVVLEHPMNEEEMEAIEALQDKEDAEELSKPDIVFTHLGSEQCPVSPDDTEVEFSMLFRIPKIEGLEACKDLRVSALSLTPLSSWASVRI